MIKSFILIFTICLAATPVNVEAKITVKSKFRVEILLEKKVYRMKEPIEGVIKVMNESFLALPAKFQVELYHKGELKHDLSVSFDELKVGHTKFDLRDFGMPNLTNNLANLGKWKLVIYPIDDEDLGDEFKFKIKQK